MEHHYKQKSLQQRPAPARNSNDDMTIVVVGTSSGSDTPTSSTADMHAAAEVAAATIVVPATPPQRARTYYVDWLRVFLTVLVLCHHCVTSYQTSQVWKAKRGDTALWLLSMLFVYGNQAYFMTLFFFLSGLYVPSSYKRKGPLHFVLDRTLRLVIPCMFYSMLVAPLLIWWGRAAAHQLDPANFPKPTVHQAFAEWYAPGWPTKFNLPTGPPWFIWMLWCFNVAYVILRVMVDFVRSRLQKRRGVSSTNLVEMQDSSSNSSSSSSVKSEYSTRQGVVGAAALTVVLFVLQYAVRAFDMYTFNIRPGQFVTRGPFVSFMPDYFAVYVVAFALGTFSGPAGWNVLARLPSGMSAWLLSIGGIWWTLFGFVPNVMLNTYMSGQLGAEAFLGTWLLRTFVEQSFAVVWSMGLLILFRESFNVRPNWFGKHVIGAAYGAYIIHWPFVALFSRVLMSLPAPSAVINAACIAPPVVICAFLVAALARAIPGADRVL